MSVIALSLQGRLTCTLPLNDAATGAGQALTSLLVRKVRRALADGFSTGI
jgi:hypothetical protein